MDGDRPQPPVRRPGRGVNPYVKKWGRTPKLTEEKVREIKEALGAGERAADIAVRYGVSTTTIGQIRVGEVWGWVDPHIPTAARDAAPPPRREAMTSNQKRALGVLTHAETALTAREVADAIGVTPRTAARVVALLTERGLAVKAGVALTSTGRTFAPTAAGRAVADRND